MPAETPLLSEPSIDQLLDPFLTGERQYRKIDLNQRIIGPVWERICAINAKLEDGVSEGLRRTLSEERDRLVEELNEGNQLIAHTDFLPIEEEIELRKKLKEELLQEVFNIRSQLGLSLICDLQEEMRGLLAQKMMHALTHTREADLIKVSAETLSLLEPTELSGELIEILERSRSTKDRLRINETATVLSRIMKKDLKVRMEVLKVLVDLEKEMVRRRNRKGEIGRIDRAEHRTNFLKAFTGVHPPLPLLERMLDVHRNQENLRVSEKDEIKEIARILLEMNDDSSRAVLLQMYRRGSQDISRVVFEVLKQASSGGNGFATEVLQNRD